MYFVHIIIVCICTISTPSSYLRKFKSNHVLKIKLNIPKILNIMNKCKNRKRNYIHIVKTFNQAINSIVEKKYDQKNFYKLWIQTGYPPTSFQTPSMSSHKYLLKYRSIYFITAIVQHHTLLASNSKLIIIY